MSYQEWSPGELEEMEKEAQVEMVERLAKALAPIKILEPGVTEQKYLGKRVISVGNSLEIVVPLPTTDSTKKSSEPAD